MVLLNGQHGLVTVAFLYCYSFIFLSELQDAYLVHGGSIYEIEKALTAWEDY